MIETHLATYKRSDRDIAVLTYVVITFLAVVFIRGAILIYGNRYQEFGELLPQCVPLLSALVAVRIANRIISNSHILREADRQQDLVRTTHHLIAITTDLRARVSYVKEMITDGRHPVLGLAQIGKSIEERYEELLQRDGFRFLPGPCVEIIIRISGSIYGIMLMAEGMKLKMSESSTYALIPIPVTESGNVLAQFDTLMDDLQQLLDQLYKLRLSIEAT